MPVPWAASFGLVSMVLPYFPKLAGRLEININNFVKQYYGCAFYFFALSFGITHITNLLNISLETNLSILAYLINPLAVGLFFAFVRIKYKNGILYAIILHSLTNLLHYLPAFFQPGNFEAYSQLFLKWVEIVYAAVLCAVFPF